MILTFWKRFFCFVLVLMLAACAVQQKLELKQRMELGEQSRDDFMNGLRWKQFKVASSLMLPEHRRDFVKTFAALRDIHVVDIRLLDLQTSMENRRFETTIEMDYYLVPSVTVKTFSFDQTWEYYEGDDPSLQGFFIVTPFPEFP